jgi:hypothetical protein
LGINKRLHRASQEHAEIAKEDVLGVGKKLGLAAKGQVIRSAIKIKSSMGIVTESRVRTHSSSGSMPKLCLAKTPAGSERLSINNIQVQETKSH